MNHHHPPSYMSVILRSLPCSHLPVHTLPLDRQRWQRQWKWSLTATHRCTKWTCSSDWMVAVCVCGLFLWSGVSVILSASFHVYRRRRKVMGARMNHQPPPSYLSVVLRPLPCSHIPLHTLPLNTLLSWLHPPSSIQNLLKWDCLKKSRHGYALDIHIFVCMLCIGYGCTAITVVCTTTVYLYGILSYGLQAIVRICTVVLMCNVLIVQ